MAKHEISISPKAIQTINEILSAGKNVRVSVVGRRLRITETVERGRVRYDVMLPEE